MELFTPTRNAGLARLAEFLPHAGRAYAEGRNTDPGPGRHSAVSHLSPYLRHRLITEAEVTQAVFAAHGEAAMKFIEEVCWRSYWKGWLEHRPAVWANYRAGVRRGENRLATSGGLRREFHDACAGQTGIDCFDAWAQELVAHGYLHNHARMWFASIWIFTLRLPWELGADFFLRHLHDGDVASNTLSWRWVAGLHTPGKHYLARAENIARYTNARFDPRGQLDETAESLTEEIPPPRPVPPVFDKPINGDVALLLHDDDCDPGSLDLAGCTVRAVAGLAMPAPRATRGVAPPVAAFAHGAVEDALCRAERRFGVAAVRLDDSAAITAWSSEHDLPVITPYAPVGPVADALAVLPTPPRAVPRAWDRHFWPHATKGFFQLRQHIPAYLASAPMGPPAP
ncbi:MULTISPECIES: FAD-binding domain-containing protein [Acidiphilium]|uniref:Deoxyribodipyrimidine photo-lyase n=1 Tax=Acidiphilium rubrum TaxID=526 RepID=A0A8G2CHS0_ACIRU|nr:MULTISPECIES: FAD-binding domain-containing protein [Acidiphilium]SIQ09636.1 deoxyribodipyrimidine photo-lyase [Acidiphilium rubrum]